MDKVVGGSRVAGNVTVTRTSSQVGYFYTGRLFPFSWIGFDGLLGIATMLYGSLREYRISFLRVM